MSNNTKNNNRALKVLIVIASVFFFLMLLTFIIAYNDHNHSRSAKYSHLYYMLSSAEYDRLYDNSCQYRAMGVKETAEAKEICAVSDYYHYSLLYYATKDSDSAQADIYYEKMKKSSSEAGELSFVIEDIDAIFADYQ